MSSNRNSRTSLHSWLALLLACVGCNALFDISPPTHAAPACTLNSDCGDGHVCLFSRCSPPCAADVDCSPKERCLHTDVGTACVELSQAGCNPEVAESCPRGTVCSEGACYAECTDLEACLDGHECRGGVCSGPDIVGAGGAPGVDPGHGGNGGNDDANEAGQSGAGGAGSTCGDGTLDGAEQCDDDNADSDDGCSSACEVEPGFSCVDTPSTCTTTCEDGVLDEGEACDDGNSETDDGCAHCRVEEGFNCNTAVEPSACLEICEEGYVSPSGVCMRPSCLEMTGTECQGGNCCASPNVAGGTFNRGNDASYPATIASFALDKLEVTVGRFKAFIDAYTGPPKSGAGAHPLIDGSGWQPAWNGSIAIDRDGLALAVQCHTKYQTWRAAGTNDHLPINCVSWYEAFAFCAWDGGRLPTEAEWEYAAAGGVTQLAYPWGNTPVPNNQQDGSAAYANYYGLGDGSAPNSFGVNDILPAGAKPLGIGTFGQLDLAGSMWEWTLDWYAAYAKTCDNCASLTATTTRSLRGGGWNSSANSLASTARDKHVPNYHGSDYGFRCARSP